MRRKPGVVSIGTDGFLRLEGESGSAELERLAGSYRLLSEGNSLIMLQRLSGEDREGRPVLMAGEVINNMSVLEAINMIATNNWRGELMVTSADSMRAMILADGALKSAFSQVPNERLGEVMVSAGALTSEQVARCVLDVGPQKRFGEIAIEIGYIDREQLLELLRVQMERIFENALLVDTGQYAFLKEMEDTSAPAMTLHLPIQGLLMKSVQRIDEMKHFREQVPSGELCPVVTNKAARLSITESLRPVALLADGNKSILDMARLLRTDEFSVTKKVAQLMRIGFLELRERMGLDHDEVSRIITILNGILGEIRKTVVRHGDAQSMNWTLGAWVRDTPLTKFFGDSLQEDGDISIEHALSVLEGLELEGPISELLQAVHELVSFAMFSAGPTLPRDTQEKLSKKINRRLTLLTKG